MACGLICSVPACTLHPANDYRCEAGWESMNGRLCWQRATIHKPDGKLDDTVVCAKHKEN